MNITLRNGNIIDELKNIHDESVDCVVSSPPYYGLRDYSGVTSYASEDYDELLRIANTDLQKHRDRVLESQKDRYYLTEPAFNEKDKKWNSSLKYDTSGVWGGNPECEHEWVSQEIHKDNLRFRDPNHIASVGNNKNQEIYSNPGTKANICSKCGAWKGQLGLEPTYQMYVEHLMLVMKELKRVLKKTGTLFWNMGDSYASSGGPSRHFGYSDPKWAKARNGSFEEPTAFDQGIKPKSLMMIPERFAMAMIDAGWILRNSIIWYKRNGVPSSVKDRLSNKWEYVFFLTKSQNYYFDLDSIRKPLAESSVKRISQKNIPNQFKSGKSMEFAKTDPVNNIPKILNNMHNSFNIRVRDAKKGILDKKWGDKYTASDEEIANYDEKNYTFKRIKHDEAVQRSGTYADPLHTHPNHPNGANPRDILLDNSDEEPRHPKGDPAIHGMRLPPQPNQKGAFNPNGANPGDVISQPSVRHKSWASNPGHKFTHERKYDPDADGGDFLDIPTHPHSFAHFAVFPETLVEPLIKAGCPPDGVVLDPFAGSGTVGVVAMKQHKNAILIEISPEYCNIIKKRLNWGAGLDVEYEEFPKADVMEAPNE